MSETPSALNTALAEELLPRWIDNPTCPIDRPYSRRLVSADECRPAVALALQSKDDSAALEIARLRAALEPFALMADKHPASWPNTRWMRPLLRPNVGDLRKARAALLAEGGKSDAAQSI